MMSSNRKQLIRYTLPNWTWINEYDFNFPICKCNIKNARNLEICACCNIAMCHMCTYPVIYLS